MYYKEESIPRIHVVKEEGNIVCALDEKLQQRFGPVLYRNKKQGKHLFSISYCIISMALKYTHMPEKNIITDILSRFHSDFITILALNSKSIATDTIFLKTWENNYDSLVHEYEELKFHQHEPLDIQGLMNYLNVVGAMLHTLPCNVAYSDNASDSEGGARAKQAIKNINRMTSRQYSTSAVNENIALIIDHGVVEEFFGKGFDQENISLLAFAIMQIRELQSLQRRGHFSHLFINMNNEKIEHDLFEIAFKRTKIPRDTAFSEAVSKAITLIKLKKREMNFYLSVGDHGRIKNIIAHGINQIYNYRDS